MRLDRDDQQRVISITRELETLKFGAKPGSIEEILPSITQLIGLENTLVYSLHRYIDRVEIERWQQDRIPDVFARLFRNALTTAPELLFYDITRPERTQRNRAIEVTSWIDREKPGTWQRSELFRTVFAPARMQNRRILRALVCEGTQLLGWFGGFQIEPVSARQRTLLSALVPAMRRRLSIERRLAFGNSHCTMLMTVMEHVGSAAFIVDMRGDIHELNAAARGLFESDKEGVRLSLRDAVAQRPPTIPMELFEIRDPGMSLHYLAIVRPNSETRRMFLVQAAAQRWSLTKKQAEVLGFIVRGFANATIANLLHVGERAVELHVSGIFDRVGVDSRSALVARVLA